MTDAQTGWRFLGDTTLAAFRTELAASPVSAEADALHDAASPYGRLYLAHSFAENKHDTVGILIKPDMFNNLALRPRGYPEERGQRNGFAVFDRYLDCLTAWRRRLRDVRLCYLDAVTLLDYARCYNPVGDVHPVTGLPNKPERYCAELLATINRLPLATTEGETPMPLPISRSIVPAVNDNRPGVLVVNGQVRPGLLLNNAPLWITVHETANTKAGADAEMHARFLAQGGGSAGVSFHFAVDDGGAIQLLPLNEVGWHAGDGADSRTQDIGAYQSVAIETCVNSDGDWNDTFRNLAALIAAIIDGDDRIDFAGRKGMFSFDRIAPHHKWSGKNCPAQIRARGLWDDLLNAVSAQLGPEPPAVPAYAKPAVPSWFADESAFNGLDRTLGATKLYACRRVFKVHAETPVLQYGDPKAKPIRAPLAAGESFAAEFVFEAGGKWWALTRTAARIPLESAEPRVGFSEAA